MYGSWLLNSARSLVALPGGEYLLLSRGSQPWHSRLFNPYPFWCIYVHTIVTEVIFVEIGFVSTSGNNILCISP